MDIKESQFHLVILEPLKNDDCHLDYHPCHSTPRHPRTLLNQYDLCQLH